MITNDHSPESIRIIAKNTVIKFLHIELHGSNESHREIYYLIPEMDFTFLHLESQTFYRSQFLGGMMEDSFFLDLTRACKCLYLTTSESEMIEKITPEALYQVYKNRTEGSTKFRTLRINSSIKLGTVVAFLRHIGIIYTNGSFYSNRDFEVYKRGVNNNAEYAIFDGFLETIFHNDHGVEFRKFTLKLHESQDSLEKAKNREGFVKVNVSPA
ncbi:hypothetical protein PENTCL1PPCAC_5314 [Pristionchus entomophagus]|uniref:Uncharacterized protein n=1 Tax=Pristionchus entomophagus TaxID=358040 RepID=A0AAV5SSH0_9BILA|nr:hypothetical protein PENTCL1PPCAC_5314 [Pristionchus entomophagus]